MGWPGRQAVLVVVLALLLCFPFLLFLVLRAIKARRHHPKYILVAKNLLSIYRPELYWWVPQSLTYYSSSRTDDTNYQQQQGLRLVTQAACVLRLRWECVHVGQRQLLSLVVCFTKSHPTARALLVSAVRDAGQPLAECTHCQRLDEPVLHCSGP